MTTNPVPAVVIAAPASGSGKTTVATGLMGALRRAGHRVSAAKVGPDFIDPGYHELATGRPGRNLDPVLVGDDLIGPLYRHGSVGADIAVIEGVMGLFDGRITEQAMSPAPGSTAHVAGLLGAPVVLVVDARGQSQSIAALLHGFSTFGQAGASAATGIAPVRIAGVLLNKVGSPRHEQVLRQACEQAGIPVFGAIPRDSGLEIPSRHLGLVTAVEHGRRAHEAVDVMTELVARHVDIEAVARCAGIGALAPPWAPDLEPVANVTVALAAGKAFSFGYAEHAELLRMAGAQVAAFDPLTDPLPDGTRALVIPGGFPEQFTAELSANAVVREQIAALAATGAPVHAECAGLTYLVHDLDGHPMCGVLRGSARFTERLTLGYRDAVAMVDSSMHAAGERVTGHEFHRTTVEFIDEQPPAWVFRGAGQATVHDGAVHGGVHAGYLHTHPAAHPHAVRRFVSAATKLAE
ncbi:cobyrinic acid a,c-diamide synthase [Mycobacterium sp. ST-F2]|uniref:cobyrinate a,c-diamide synthase n=1 Tax=Mycobacterium sp. ST-F2 TaxID=1490484 RepID=UPI00093BF51D|nr:cobyrinate a,c-diamide synthase [Mycobacterium sp. ST-F2]OKH83986.1 cobyrinic acid a,c-diamide synthase [Mycobacterium sp. ST-F2]